MKRRHFLTRATVVASTIGITGCSSVLSSTIPVKVGVINGREETHVVNLEITDEDETIFTQNLEVKPSGQAVRDGDPYWPEVTIDNLIVEGAEYHFSVEIGNGDSRTKRVVADCTEEDSVHGWTGRLQGSGGF